MFREREEGAEKFGFRLIVYKSLLSRWFNKLGILLYENFSSDNGKKFQKCIFKQIKLFIFVIERQRNTLFFPCWYVLRIK